MTSRERVVRSLTFSGTDRIPMCLPEPFTNDLAQCSTTADPDWHPSRTWQMEDGAQWEDEWGNVWRRLSTTTGGEVIEGAVRDWQDLDRYRMPRLDLACRYTRAREIFAEYPDRYRLGGLAGFPFAIMRYLRRVEEFLADVLLYPDQVMELQSRVVDLLKRCMDRWKEAGADGVVFCEDWGTQERLLVSPDTWVRMFRPGYEELTCHARQQGLTVWMHSCGYIRDIVPHLRDAGISVLQLDQPTLSGIDWLRETVGGRVNIWSPVDIQRILPTGDRDLIRSSVREMIEKLGSFGGGFMAKYYGSNESLGVKPEWQRWACEAFEEYASLGAQCPAALRQAQGDRAVE